MASRWCRKRTCGMRRGGAQRSTRTRSSAHWALLVEPPRLWCSGTRGSKFTDADCVFVRHRSIRTRRSRTTCIGWRTFSSSGVRAGSNCPGFAMVISRCMCHTHGVYYILRTGIQTVALCECLYLTSNTTCASTTRHRVGIGIGIGGATEKTRTRTCEVCPSLIPSVHFVSF